METPTRGGAGAERDLLEHRALAGRSRARVLEALRGSDAPLDADDIASLVGLHRNTVRAHLAVLERGGLVERTLAGRTTPGRPRIVYRAAPERESAYLVLSRILADGLARGRRRVSEGMEEAGRAWGRAAADAPAVDAPARAAADAPAVDAAGADTDAEDDADAAQAASVDRMVELLDELGFAPEVAPGSAPGSSEILLHACPFRAVAEEHPEIVCSVHLGLIRGALERLGADVEASGLEPFVEPELCIAHLSAAEAVR